MIIYYNICNIQYILYNICYIIMGPSTVDMAFISMSFICAVSHRHARLQSWCDYKVPQAPEGYPCDLSAPLRPCGFGDEGYPCDLVACC